MPGHEVSIQQGLPGGGILLTLCWKPSYFFLIVIREETHLQCCHITTEVPNIGEVLELESRQTVIWCDVLP
jgi:hypothetical protein